MGLLVSIDNGGTLTDVCAIDGARTVHAKTLTTPHDLTECFVKGLRALSEKLYGEADLGRLVADADYIRYSTTQGTNAIVQRKGPRLGWLVDDRALVDEVAAAAPELYQTFIADRVQVVKSAGAEADPRDLVRANAALVAAGANRIVVGLVGDDAAQRERAVKRALYRAFPRHLLGAVPMLFSCELSRLGSTHRRIWAAFINSFLHPAMENFLYNAENRLRDYRTRRPLLIFANDGNSTRVAKTVAVKTYSSGPQGGIVGSEMLLAHYGRAQAVSIDIGGTTADIALFRDGRASVHQQGEVEGAPVPIPLTDVRSIGAGGSSIIRAVDGKVTVGPESVGSTPGPACFARGGTQATITDAFLLLGVLDPSSYFGGQLTLDRERAEQAVMEHIGKPLGLSCDDAVDAMLQAHHAKVADALPGDTPPELLLAFGGAGPMSACGVAERAGVDEIVVPRYAAVFCAYGISFSDVRHSHLEPLNGAGDGEFAHSREQLVEKVRRDMLAEGFALEGCALEFALLEVDGDAGYKRTQLDGAPADWQPGSWLELSAARAIDKPELPACAVEAQRAATADGVRAGRDDLPLFRLEHLQPGDWGEGPCLVEEAFFTTWVRPGWRFVISATGDIVLQRGNRA